VTTDAEADKRTALVADLARRLRGHASTEEIVELVTIAAGARSAKVLADVEGAVSAILAGETKKATSALSPTFEKFADEWTSGRLRVKHPDHVREKDATRDVGVLRDYVNPQIGATRIADVTLQHAERVMSKLPATLAPRSRLIVAQCMRKVLSLAVYPGRFLSSNPIPREWMPKIPKSANKAKTCLYPAEDERLLACMDVTLERRLAYGILAREGLRASELETLKWRDVDLEHGRVRLDANKTDDPRAWALSSDVARTLTWWKKRTGAEVNDLVLGLELADAAWWLRGDAHFDPSKPESSTNSRGDLRRAGITRAELFERSTTRQPFRLHDLRATFVTVSLANGKTEQWVTDRTGHTTSQMLAKYTRQARTWAELDLGTLADLDALIPEVRA
jgi:integrase